MKDAMPSVSAGAALFTKLKALGVDYVFANSGTDFPPIIEGLVEARQKAVELPMPVTVPHEHVAMGMAHGYYQMSGRMAAVMLHTNVGLANGATGAINAACDQVPIFMMSGRTPVTEGGRFGARTVPIGWGQEMYDQHALIREACKWDYELRFPEQVSDVLERGCAIARSTPQGPVYLSLPREVLCAPCPTEDLNTGPRIAAVEAAAPKEGIEQAAALLCAAERPLIIAQRGVQTQEAFAALTALVEDWAIPVSHYWANKISVPMSSPMHVEWMPDDLLAQADVILVIDALAPWWPDHVAPCKERAKVIQLGPDPLFMRSTPMRSFASTVSLATETAQGVIELAAAVNRHPKAPEKIAKRRAETTERSSAERARIVAQAERGNTGPMSKEWVSLCLGRAIKGRKASVFHELGCPLPPLQLDEINSYFQEPHSGGLGWGLPAAMGAQLAQPDRLIFATIGDGSYMFANPTACHQVCEALDLPVITLVLNNEEWGAVRHSVEGLYQGGLASRSNDVPLTSLRPSPDFTMTAAASRAYTETITEGKELPAALDRVIQVATTQRRQCLLNIAIARTNPH